jgi:hypothetical protein
MANAHLQKVEYQVRDAHSAAREGNLAVAQSLIDEIGPVLAAAGITSPYVIWLSAVVADGLGRHLEAMTLIDTASRLDPVSPPTRNSRRLIFARGRDEFQAAVSRGDLSEARLLFDALLRADEADLAVHYRAALLGTPPWRRHTNA